MRFGRATTGWSGLWNRDKPGTLEVGAAFHGRFGDNVAMEVGVHGGGGDDGSGYRRWSVGYVLPNVMVYFTPKSRFQLYALAGFNLDAQGFTSTPDGPIYSDLPKSYLYMGGTGGFGIETRTSKHIALRFEIAGYLRARVDSEKPEDAAAVGAHPDFDRDTKVSKGVMFNLGFVYF